jgi:AraC family transcriptional regulator
MEVHRMAEPALLDFTSKINSPFLSVQSRVAQGGIIVSRCRMPGNPGARIATAQLTLLVQESASVDLTCRLPGGGGEERHRVSAGQFHVSPAHRVAEVSWTAEKQELIIALEDSWIERIVGEAFGGRVPEIRNRAAIRDPSIEALAACLRHEMTGPGRCSRLCLDYVSASLALRLFEVYGENGRPQLPFKGGLSGYQRKRILEFIDAHLKENISLAALAAEAGLSPHHFGKAFKASFGITPCQYVTRRRVRRAKELLLSDHRSITDVAYTLGFCSHSHLTETFRKVTGMTPSEFRKKGR